MVSTGFGCLVWFLDGEAGGESLFLLVFESTSIPSSEFGTTFIVPSSALGTLEDLEDFPFLFKEGRDVAFLNVPSLLPVVSGK